MEDYIRVFLVVDGKPLSYGLRDSFEPNGAIRDPTHRANNSEYFTHDEEIIARGSIISGPTVVGSDPEAIGPFTDSSVTDRVLI